LSARSISDCEVSSVRNSAKPMGNRHAAEPLAARSFHQFLGHDRAADVVGDGDRQAQGRVWKRDDEFLAAVTG